MAYFVHHVSKIFSFHLPPSFLAPFLYTVVLFYFFFCRTSGSHVKKTKEQLSRKFEVRATLLWNDVCGNKLTIRRFEIRFNVGTTYRFSPFYYILIIMEKKKKVEKKRLLYYKIPYMLFSFLYARFHYENSNSAKLLIYWSFRIANGRRQGNDVYVP